MDSIILVWAWPDPLPICCTGKRYGDKRAPCCVNQNWKGVGLKMIAVTPPPHLSSDPFPYCELVKGLATLKVFYSTAANRPS